MAKRKKRASSKGAAPRRARSGSGGVKRRRRKSRGFLSEGGGTKKGFASGIKSTLGAMAGGAVGVAVNKLIPASVGKLGRLGLIFGVGLAASFINAPNMGAGMIGSLTASTFPNGFLNDGETEFADESVLDDDSPLFLDDDGNYMVLDEDGQGGLEYRYLSEDELDLMERQDAFDSYTEVI